MKRGSVRRFLGGFVIGCCLLVVVHVWLLEAFVVPTGSMAPALAGHHRAAVCPCCGFTVRVGRHPEDCDGAGVICREAACSNCGFGPLPLDMVPETTGDHILVNKSAFLFRRPRRWEIIVFRMFGKIFVKRIAGLPGEWLAIFDGDLFADDQLVRKTLDQLAEVRILVFDNNYLPKPDGGAYRWDYACLDNSGAGDAAAVAGTHEGDEGDEGEHEAAERLLLDGAGSPRRNHWLSYRHFSMKSGKDEPLLDEYAYNAGWPRRPQPVHDFMLECDLQVSPGNGRVLLAICDGADTMLVEMPVGKEKLAALYRQRGSAMPPRQLGEPALAREWINLQPGRTHHIELALVDRRLTMRVDGAPLFRPVDLPLPGKRGVVTRPVSVGVHGARAEFRNILLYRDVHYTQAGRNAVHGKVVRLGADQYFVMGDNSPNSEDSRFWPDHGVLPGDKIIGKALAVHLPSRVVRGPGMRWQCQIPDWRRMRWLR